MTTFTVQDHIHLSDVLGTAPENSPNITWKVVDQDEIPVVFVSVKRGLKGHLRVNRVMSAGSPLRLTNWEFKLKIDATDSQTVDERKAALLALFGKPCYLVPNKHCADGADHTAYVQRVYLTHIDKFSADDLKLRFYYVTIQLEDATLM